MSDGQTNCCSCPMKHGTEHKWKSYRRWLSLFLFLCILGFFFCAWLKAVNTESETVIRQPQRKSYDSAIFLYVYVQFCGQLLKSSFPEL